MTDNTADSNTQHGIYLNSSSSNTLRDNNALDSTSGNSIYLDNSDNNTLDNNTASLSFRGIYLNDSSNNTLTNNTVNSNNFIGVYLNTSPNNTLSGNTSSDNQHGIYIEDSSPTTIINNIIDSNFYGIYLNSSSSNTLTSNKFLKNQNNLFDANTNTYSSNEFLHNITTTMITFDDITDREVNVGDTINFGDINMLDVDGDACPSCTYNITTSPEETITVNQDSNVLSGNFDVSRNGIYSLIIKITDGDSNEAEIQMRIFVGDTTETTTRYYYRGISPTHGQPYGTANDSKTLYSTLPMETEEWWCSNWVQNSPDELMDISHAILENADVYVWYKIDNDGYIGLERYLTHSINVDEQENIDASVDFTWINKTFSDINWMMDYQWSWYWLAFKVRGESIRQQTTVAQPSYADITYLYSTAPNINSMDNENIIILSATMPTTDDTISLVLENPESSTTSTSLTIGTDNPFLDIVSTINSTGTTTINSGSISANSSTTLASIDIDIVPASGSVEVLASASDIDLDYQNSAIVGLEITGIDREIDINNDSSSSMIITPDANSVDIVINTWNTSGTYAKQWTEASSESSVVTSHTVGDLSAGTYYTVWYTKDGEDQASLTTLLADANREIEFDYDQGYSTVIFDILEDTNSPTSFSLSSPNSDSHTSNSNPTLTWNASTDSESGLAKYQLYVDSSLDTDNISSSATNVEVASALDCGSHTWYIRAYDNNNNYTDSSTYTIIKDCGGGFIAPPPSVGTGSADASIPMDQTTGIGDVDSGGKNLLMYINSTANFDTVVSNYGHSLNQNHNLEITDLDLLNNIVTITIHSDPLTLELALDETKYIDLDNDGINDLEVKFEDIVVNRAEITVKSLIDNNVDSDHQSNVEYTLFKYPNSPKVYLLEDDLKRWIKDEYTFNTKGYDWNDIETIDDSVTYLDGEDIYETILDNQDIANNSYTFTSFLNIGAVGEEVRQLQTKLKELGYFTYQYITGYYGPITAQAVKDFQQVNNIESVGYVGPKTRSALNK